jgi:hypothetical protein
MTRRHETEAPSRGKAAYLPTHVPLTAADCFHASIGSPTRTEPNGNPRWGLKACRSSTCLHFSSSIARNLHWLPVFVLCRYTWPFVHLQRLTGTLHNIGCKASFVSLCLFSRLCAVAITTLCFYSSSTVHHHNHHHRHKRTHHLHNNNDDDDDDNYDNKNDDDDDGGGDNNNNDDGGNNNDDDDNNVDDKDDDNDNDKDDDDTDKKQRLRRRQQQQQQQQNDDDDDDDKDDDDDDNKTTTTMTTTTTTTTMMIMMMMMTRTGLPHSAYFIHSLPFHRPSTFRFIFLRCTQDFAAYLHHVFVH